MPTVTPSAQADVVTSGNWTDSGNYDTTIATAAAANITITTAKQLAGLAVAVNGGKNYSGFTVTLGTSIDLSEHYWIPIGNGTTNFVGSFNGGSFSVSGMTINTTTTQYVGLFGIVSGTGTISNISVSGTVNATYSSGILYAGGLVGYVINKSFNNCAS